MKFSNGNSSFCVRPFLQYSSFNDHKFRLCCSAKSFEDINTKELDIREFFNSGYMRKVREQLFRGEPIPECESCYQLESVGARSDRTRSNLELEERYSELLEDAQKNDFRVPGPTHLDLRLGNVCNLKCQSCFPDLSVGLFDDVTNLFGNSPELRPQPGGLRKLEPGFEVAQVLDVIDGVEKIKLIGGEPLLNSSAHELISELAKAGVSQRMTLDLHTNLTVWDEALINKILSFQRVTLGLSMDGPEMVNEYMRYPSKWGEVLENFHRWVKIASVSKNLHLRVTPVVQVTNSFSIFRLLEFLIDELQIFSNNVGLSHIILTEPRYHSLMFSPKEFKQMVRKELDTFVASRKPADLEKLEAFIRDFEQILESDGNDIETRKYLKSVEIYEGHRPSGIAEVFPQIQYLKQFCQEI